jgi:hypothetical protein
MSDPSSTAAVPPPAALPLAGESAPPAASDPRPASVLPTAHERAWSLYRDWRNAHLGDLPAEFFHRIEAAAEHLVAAIKKEI